MIWVLIPHAWLKQSAKDGTNNQHIDGNRHISRVIKVWSCTYLIIFLTIVEVWLCILYFYGCQSLIMHILSFDNHQSLIMYFIFQWSLKFDHVSYILIVVEVWSCYLIFWWFLRFQSCILYFDGCWSLIMYFNVATQLLKFGQSYNFLCFLHTPLSNKSCVFFFSLYKPGGSFRKKRLKSS